MKRRRVNPLPNKCIHEWEQRWGFVSKSNNMYPLQRRTRTGYSFGVVGSICKICGEHSNIMMSVRNLVVESDN